MRDTSLDHDRPVWEREPEVVQRIELERKGAFDLEAAGPDFPNRDGLKDHHLGVQAAKDRKAVRATLLVVVPHPPAPVGRVLSS
jgi:hypothetical protein